MTVYNQKPVYWCRECQDPCFVKDLKCVICGSDNLEDRYGWGNRGVKNHVEPIPLEPEVTKPHIVEDKRCRLVITFKEDGGYEHEFHNYPNLLMSQLIYTLERIKFNYLQSSEKESNDE